MDRGKQIANPYHLFGAPPDRLARGLSSRCLSRTAGLSANAVNAIETGKLRSSLIDAAFAICGALGVSLAELLAKTV